VSGLSHFTGHVQVKLTPASRGHYKIGLPVEGLNLQQQRAVLPAKALLSC